MTISEKVSMLLVLAIVFGVFAAEAGLLLAAVLKALVYRPVKKFLFSKTAIVIHVLAAVFVICYLYGYFIESNWIEVKTVNITTPKLKAASFRIVQISDIHCEAEPRNEEKLVGMVNALKPDVIIFTGDTMNTMEGLGLFKETMQNLKAGLAKIAVYGNYDFYFWNYLDLYGGTGFKVLDKDSITIEKAGEKIAVSGLNCKYSQKELQTALADIPADRFSIFACHYSDFVESLKGYNVDLYLSGHTHGGQVALPWYGAIITLSTFGKKYEAGKYTVGNTILYVNRGIGMEGYRHAPRIRFFARPEITVFEIGPDK